MGTFRKVSEEMGCGWKDGEVGRVKFPLILEPCFDLFELGMSLEGKRST